MEEVSRHRLRWWLRGERALGLRHVYAPGGGLLGAPAIVGTAAAREAAPPVRPTVTPVARPAARGTPANVSANPAVPGTSEPRRATPSPAAAEWFGGDAQGDAQPTPGANDELFASPVLAPAAKAAALAELDAAQVKGCTKCPLCRSRKNTVFGEGDPDARLMFVGEGPGYTEDDTGRPFVGKAGIKLTEMIEKGMGLRRSDVYICNVVKCRAYLPGPPPKDRPPQPDEAATCMPYLVRQIEVVRPAVIVTLGLSASQYLLGVKQTMSRMRGNWHRWKGIPVMPTFHPSYVLRNYTPETRRAVWEDLKKASAALAAPPAEVG